MSITGSGLIAGAALWLRVWSARPGHGAVDPIPGPAAPR